MKLYLNDTGEYRELVWMHNGVNCATDIVGNSGAIGEHIRWDAEHGHYVTTSDHYTWWHDYMAANSNNHNELQAILNDILVAHGYIAASEAEYTYNYHMALCDYESERTAHEATLDTLRSQYHLPI